MPATDTDKRLLGRRSGGGGEETRTQRFFGIDLHFANHVGATTSDRTKRHAGNGTGTTDEREEINNSDESGRQELRRGRKRKKKNTIGVVDVIVHTAANGSVVTVYTRHSL